MKFGFHKYIAALFLAGLQFAVQAQVPDVQSRMEAILESVTDELEPEADAAIIMEDLEGYALNPLNINTATRDQLSRLHLLDDIQIDKLLMYRQTYGAILAIYELNAIDGFYPETLMKMEPFIWFGPPEEKPRNFSDIIGYGRHEVLLRSTGTIQIPEGYKERDDGSVPYEGNRFRYYSRYRFNSGDDLTAGITAEKDPGEAFFKGSNTSGFDFYSANVSFKVNSFIQNVTVGDFIVRSGQGLVIWQGFSLNKSLDALNTYKTNQGIRPYTSSDENQFFRGIGTTLGVGNTKLCFFFSKKKSDGNLAFSDSAGNYFTSLQTSGYHRTLNEIADKNKVGDLNAGFLGSKWNGNLKMGVVFIYRKFELPFIPAEQLFNQFNFRGAENFTAGTDYLFSKGRYQLFGEAGVSKSGGVAALQGITAHLHDRLQMSALFRHFDRNYHALWAAPFAESTKAANETGLYLGSRILLVKYLTLVAYSDYHRSRWIKYTTSGPSTGWDVFTQADFVPSDRFRIYFRYKNEEKDKKFRMDKKNEDLPEQVRKCRLQLQYNFSETVVLKTRLEHVFYQGIEKENGNVLFQDLQLMPRCLPLILSTRLAWFNTDSYNSRIYAYENDLLYSFAIPAYYGRGFRIYLNMKYKLGDRTEVWLKMANTQNTGSIGSGYNEIQGNQKTELKFQLRLKI